MDTKKELKNKYKQTPRPMGIYQIKNTVNGKILIGRSLNLEGSKNSYLYQLDFKRHHYEDLQEDISLHGYEAFTFDVLETIDPDKYSQEEYPFALEIMEEKWLETLEPYGEKGYHRRKNRRD